MYGKVVSVNKETKYGSAALRVCEHRRASITPTDNPLQTLVSVRRSPLKQVVDTHEGSWGSLTRAMLGMRNIVVC